MNFSKQVESHTAILQKNTQFHWSLKAQHAFKQLKLAFTTAPVLANLHMMQAFVVGSHSSGTVILSQSHASEQIYTPSPTAQGSFTPAEQNYGILDKELLENQITFEEW